MWCCVSFFGTGKKKFLVLRTYLVNNTVVQLCQFFYGVKVNFVRIPYIHNCFSKISRTFFVIKLIPYKTYVQEDKLFLASYGSTTIQSLLFLKNIKNFVWVPKEYLLGFFILEEQLANILDRGFLLLRNTLLLYSLNPYWQTESLTESQIHLLRMGWRNLFSSCQFLVLAGNRFWFFILLMMLEYHTIVVLC